MGSCSDHNGNSHAILEEVLLHHFFKTKQNSNEPAGDWKLLFSIPLIIDIFGLFRSFWFNFGSSKVSRNLLIS